MSLAEKQKKLKSIHIEIEREANRLNEGIGRSAGGFTTKIHAGIDGIGSPKKIMVTGGNVTDCKIAIPMMEGISTDAVIMDKAYDTDEILSTVAKMKPASSDKSTVDAVIPSKNNRIHKRQID